MVKRAVLLTSYPFPDDAATANRADSLATALALKEGWEVTVLGPGPRLGKEKANEVLTAELVKRKDGSKWLPKPYQIESCSCLKFPRDRLFSRALGEIRQALILLRAARRHKPDFFIVMVPSPFLLLAPFVLGGNRTLVDIRDIVWEYLQKSEGRLALVGNGLERIAKWALQKSAYVSTTNEAQAEKLRELGLSNNVVLQNGIGSERMACLEQIPPAGGPKEYLSVLYSGNLGRAQELETLLLAVAGEPKIRVVLIGDGVSRSNLKELIDKEKIENVDLKGPLPWEETLPYYEAADVLYGQIGASYASAVPSKLFEYIAVGRRVIFAAPKGPATSIMARFYGVSTLVPCDFEKLRARLHAEVKQCPLAEYQVQANRHLLKEEFLRERTAGPIAEIAERIVMRNR